MLKSIICPYLSKYTFKRSRGRVIKISDGFSAAVHRQIVLHARGSPLNELKAQYLGAANRHQHHHKSQTKISYIYNIGLC